MRLKQASLLVLLCGGCATLPPPYQQTYHDPRLPNLDLIHVGDKEWVDKSAESYGQNSDAKKFFGVFGDITVIQLPKDTTDDD